MEQPDLLREHLDRFYDLLHALTVRIGGTRTLAECDGRMDWPRRGVYFFFEAGEQRGPPNERLPRVVRVGTHAVSDGSKTTLWERLKQHRGSGGPGDPARGGNHRGSIFRRHAGAALIAAGRVPGPRPPSWGLGQSAPREVIAEEESAERCVSEYIGRMPFVWLEVDDEPGTTSLRAYLERNSIALLAGGSRLVPPSASWLGRHAEEPAIRGSGLWNVKYVEESYVSEFLDTLEDLAMAPEGEGDAVTIPMAAEPSEPSRASGAYPRPVLAIVSCTKRKASHTCPASELYRPSAFFRMAYDFARREAEATLILSAKYGLLRPDTIVDPYEQTLAGASSAVRREWAARVIAQLRASPEYRDANTVLWLAGEAYRIELLPAVVQDGKACWIPLQGLSQGRQLGWLNDALARRPRALLSPPRQQPGTIRSSVRAGRADTTPSPTRTPKADDFAKALRSQLEKTRQQGRAELVVTAGELHRIVGGYPGQNHRMPICCRVMRSEMRSGDRIISEPPSGQGASLTICYRTSR